MLVYLLKQKMLKVPRKISRTRFWVLIVNSRDTALSSLYDINTVLIFSLIYSILFSTNILERTEKKRRRHQCYYLFIIMLLLIVVHWHCLKHSRSAAGWLVKKLFLQVFARLWGTPVTKYTRYGSHLITFMATTICHQGDLNLFSGLIRIWFLESSKIPLEVNCQVNWGQTIYKLLIMAGHRVQEHLRGLNLCY